MRSELMGPLSGTLAAISMGAVYMGALTYIGNAPNFMVARDRGRSAASGCRASSATCCWAAAILVPLFLLLTFLPIAPVLRLQ